MSNRLWRGTVEVARHCATLFVPGQRCHAEVAIKPVLCHLEEKKTAASSAKCIKSQYTLAITVLRVCIFDPKNNHH